MAEVKADKSPRECWLRTSEFAAKYGVTVWTARRWAREGKVTAIRVPPGPRARIFVKDPGWVQVDLPSSSDPAEWVCIFSQREAALLLNISPRWLRYLESAGRAHYRLVGHRKLYSICEIRRLIAERTLGHTPRNRRERRAGMLRWAFQKLNRNEEAAPNSAV
jgi:hypothetical protein